MKRILAVVLAAVIGLSMFGCGRKEAPLPVESQEAMSTEALMALSANMTTVLPGATKPAVATPTPTPVPAREAAAVSVIAPSAQEIQAALKNAGYYAGAIDGKIGPRTKKAIEDFQKAKGLAADGKVGPKTWAVLSKYLNPAPGTTVPKTR